MAPDDPRLQPGAYITNGTELLCVVRVVVPYARSGHSTRVYAEDCKALRVKQYPVDAIRGQFRLVRAAPFPAQDASSAAWRAA
jgi:hypothetical protein